jgi:hypothetical protein
MRKVAHNHAGGSVPAPPPHNVLPAIDRAISLANTLLTAFDGPSGLDGPRRQEVEDGVAELLHIRDALAPLLDPDGFLRNWLVDVVREIRRGTPGAARYELDQVSKRLEALRAQWK